MAVRVRKKLRQYSPQALTNAYKCVVEKKWPVLKASKHFMVPENTLRDRVLGKVDHDSAEMGRAPLFTHAEEEKIVQHFKKMANYGYGYTLQECVNIASDYAVQLGKRAKDNPLTVKWMNGLRKRWPEIKTFSPRALEHVRAKMTSESTVNKYFEDLERCLKKHDLLDKPHLIYNVDEKGVSINHKPPNIVAGADVCPQSVTSGKGKTVTILGCGSASGVAVPPYFVFPGKNMNGRLLEGATPGASGTVSETGWSNSEVFRKWLETHFLQFIPGRKEEKVLLMLDGHRSHVSVGLVEWALEHNVVLFVLPAHTSHLLQPLDVACYGPFQRMYNYQCHDLIRRTAIAITKYNICEIACKVYGKALSANNLYSAFRKTGISPWNPNGIQKKYLIPSEVYQISDEDSDADSEATVEGGVVADVSMFDRLENELKSVKSNTEKKPRNTLSKLVSGKEITDNVIAAAIEAHVNAQPTPLKRKCKVNSPISKKSKPSNGTSLKKKPNNGKSSKPTLNCEPQPGTSHINLVQSDSDESDSEIPEEELCCVCKCWAPPAARNNVYISFTKWVQCDGMKDGALCKHWTHLGYCTDKRVIRRGETFLCIHCTNEE